MSYYIPVRAHPPPPPNPELCLCTLAIVSSSYILCPLLYTLSSSDRNYCQAIELENRDTYLRHVINRDLYVRSHHTQPATECL